MLYLNFFYCYYLQYLSARTRVLNVTIKETKLHIAVPICELFCDSVISPYTLYYFPLKNSKWCKSVSTVNSVSMKSRYSHSYSSILIEQMKL